MRQNVLKSDLKKSPICPIWRPSDREFVEDSATPDNRSGQVTFLIGVFHVNETSDLQFPPLRYHQSEDMPLPALPAPPSLAALIIAGHFYIIQLHPH